MDVILLADGEESSMEEVDAEHCDGQPKISRGDNDKEDVGGGRPLLAGVHSLGQELPEKLDEETVEFPRALEDEIYDVQEFNRARAAGCNSSGRQTAVSPQGHKAGIPLLGKPKVRCYKLFHAKAGCDRWTNKLLQNENGRTQFKGKHNPGVVEDTELKWKNVASAEDTASA
jgi:hypothetical protein